MSKKSKRVQVPEGYRLPDQWKAPRRKHAWLVKDVIEILSDYDEDAMIWFHPIFVEDHDDKTLYPVEMAAGDKKNVFLS